MTITKKISVKAVVIGFLIEICLFAIAWIGIVVIAALLQNHALDRGASPLTMGTNGLVAILVAGSMLYLFVGYVTGHIARRSEVLNAGVVGGAFVVFGFLGLGQSPQWFEVLGLASTISFHIAGGFLAQKRRLQVNKVAIS